MDNNMSYLSYDQLLKIEGLVAEISGIADLNNEYTEEINDFIFKIIAKRKDDYRRERKPD